MSDGGRRSRSPRSNIEVSSSPLSTLHGYVSTCDVRCDLVIKFHILRLFASFLVSKPKVCIAEHQKFTSEINCEIKTE